MAPKKIEIYASSTCPYCLRAKSLLRQKGVSFQEWIVDGNPTLIAEAVSRSGGLRTVPQIFIDNDPIGGYDDLYALDQQGKLDERLGLTPGGMG